MRGCDFGMIAPSLRFTRLELAIHSARLLRRPWVPPGSSGMAHAVNSLFRLQLSDERLHLVARKKRQHLHELHQLTPLRLVVLNVLQQEGFVRFPVQPLPSRIYSPLPEEAVEVAGEQVARPAPRAHSLDDAELL